MPNWGERERELARLAERQLFFVAGAPRSGTTWLQQILDCHPEISCRGEGLFRKHLAEPLEQLMGAWGAAIAAKNSGILRETPGYALPQAEDADFLIRTAILLALQRQSAGKDCRAIGEKTPENVFFFPKLKALFPAAKLICIVRDPRDVVSSAWHFFHRPVPGEDEVAAKIAFLRFAFPSIQEGTRTMLELRRLYPAHCLIVSYEEMRADLAPVAAGLFRFLGVADGDEIVADCVARTEFGRLSGGRAAAQAGAGAFYRKGIVGDWRTTLTPEMAEMVVRELGWMFPEFGWRP